MLHDEYYDELYDLYDLSLILLETYCLTHGIMIMYDGDGMI